MSSYPFKAMALTLVGAMLLTWLPLGAVRAELVTTNQVVEHKAAPGAR